MKTFNRNTVIAAPRPNWANSVKEDYTFSTSIFRSRNGTEKREAMRQTARVSLQYVTAMKREGMQRHMADLAGDPTQLFFVPTRWRSAFLSEAAATAQDVLIVGTPPFWLKAGQPVVISDDVNEEAAIATAVAGSAVTLDRPLSVPFSAGSRVMMARQARSASKVSFDALTGRLWAANVRFDVDPGSEPQAYPESSPTMFEGREVFLREPNWKSGIGNDFEALFETVDSGRGVITVTMPEIDIVRIEKMGYVGMSAAATESLLAFFLRHKGRRTGFFMPSWQADVTQKGGQPSGSSSLLVGGPDFKTAYEDSRTFNVLLATFADGTKQVNRISGFELVGLDSSLTMADGWNQDVTADTRFSFCHHCRFASDTLTVQWVTGGVSEIEIAVQTIQAGEND